MNVREPRASDPNPEPLGIGERLRNAREARGLTLAAAETLVRIRAVYLQALEEERFDQLPAPVYARGYLRTYALALGLDPDVLMDAYPIRFDTRPQPLVPTFPGQIPIRPAVPPSRMRRIAIYVGGSVLLIVLVLGLIGYQQLRQFVQPVPRAAPTLDAAPQPSGPLALPEPTPTPPPAAKQPTGAPPPTAVAGVELVVKATGASWLRVVVDGEEVFQGLVNAGDVKTWQARDRLTVHVGNTPAVSVRVNGQLIQLDPQRPVWEQTFTAP